MRPVPEIEEHDRNVGQAVDEHLQGDPPQLCRGHLREPRAKRGFRQDADYLGGHVGGNLVEDGSGLPRLHLTPDVRSHGKIHLPHHLDDLARAHLVEHAGYFLVGHALDHLHGIIQVGGLDVFGGDLRGGDGRGGLGQRQVHGWRMRLHVPRPG